MGDRVTIFYPSISFIVSLTDLSPELYLLLSQTSAAIIIATIIPCIKLMHFNIPEPYN